MVMPWLTYALLSDPKMKKKGLGLGKKLSEANALLQSEVRRRQRKLEKTLSFDGVSAPAKKRARKR
jgi:hypothetical protein